ncbi:MAG: hypothetical protein ACK5PF_12110, partial [bacterium]
ARGPRHVTGRRLQTGQRLAADGGRAPRTPNPDPTGPFSQRAGNLTSNDGSQLGRGSVHTGLGLP